MTRKELEALPKRDWEEETPLLDELYIVVDRKKHISGYRFINVYGIAKENGNITYAKKLTSCSDVLHFSPKLKSLIPCENLFLFSIDTLESNVIRLFVLRKRIKFKVGVSLSDFDIAIVEL